MKCVERIRFAALAGWLTFSCCACTALKGPVGDELSQGLVHRPGSTPVVTASNNTVSASSWRPASDVASLVPSAAVPVAAIPNTVQSSPSGPPPSRSGVVRLPDVDLGAAPWPRPPVGESFAAFEEPIDAPVFSPSQCQVGPPENAGMPAYTGFDPPPYSPSYALEGSGSTFVNGVKHEWLNIKSDYGNYYSCQTLRDMGIALAITAPIANTSVDQHFRNWYQDDVRSSGTDRFAKFWKVGGEGAYIIPGFIAVGVVGKMFDQQPVFHIAGELGERTTRAYLVGGPPMILMQYVLGAARPTDNVSYPSYWRPFQDSNGVSGHAFIGAVPWITAAKMTDNLALKGGFYVLSTFTAWSRINDDAHFLSQAILGWSMAYIACRAVDQTETNKNLIILPVASPEMTGVQLIYTY